MTEKYPITPQGYEKLRNDLKELGIKQQKTSNEIEEARAHGDLKENAEYHAAKEKQGHIGAQIAHLNNILANSEVIDPSLIKAEQIVFGATVTYENTETGENKSWQIVGQEEADINNNQISINSPIAKALLGKAVGDIVTIKIPKGIIEVEIIDLKYN